MANFHTSVEEIFVEAGLKKHPNLKKPVQPEVSQNFEPENYYGTFAFTDIVDSSAKWEIDQAAMNQARELHNEIIRDGLARWRGDEVNTLGDGFFAHFRRAEHALLFGLEVQALLQTQEWPPELTQHESVTRKYVADYGIGIKGLTIRMGLHHGSPFKVEINPVTQRLDYYGCVINETARLMSEGEDYQIAVSDSFILELYRVSQGGQIVELTAELTDTMRRKILTSTIWKWIARGELAYVVVDLEFKGYCKLKGITKLEYITLIHVCKLMANDERLW